MKNKLVALSCAALLGAWSAGTSAADEFGVSAMYGTDNSSNASVDMYQLGFQWKWPGKVLDLGSSWNLGGYMDFAVGYWNNDSPQATNSGLWDVGITPTLRLQQTTPWAVSPFLEAGVGVHYLSETSVSQGRQFGSNFSFGDHIGIGVSFGPRNAFEFLYRYQHLSNLGIGTPNNGINFNELRLGCWF